MAREEISEWSRRATKKKGKIQMLTIFWPKSFVLPYRTSVCMFLDAMTKRIVQGHFGYGEPNKSKKYLTRLKMECREYEKTGNLEHLYNIAVYAWLESEAPMNKKFHFDNTVDSVTRGKI